MSAQNPNFSNRTGEDFAFKPDTAQFKEVVKETYELKDKNGNVVCNAEVEFEPLAEDDKTEGKQRILKSFIIEKDGKFVDVLEIIGKDTYSKIICDSNELANFKFSYDDKVVRIPPLTNLYGIAIALHEFGHAQQSQDEFFKNSDHIIRGPVVRVEIKKDPMEYFSRIAKIFPELTAYLPPQETIKKMDDLKNLILDAKKAQDEMSDELKNSTDLIPERRVKLKNKMYKSFLLELDLNKEFGDKFEEIDAFIYKITRLIEQSHEKDATRRAFVLMEKIQELIDVDIMNTPIEVTRQTKKLLSDMCYSYNGNVPKKAKFAEETPKGILLAFLYSYGALGNSPMPNLKGSGKTENKEVSPSQIENALDQTPII